MSTFDKVVALAQKGTPVVNIAAITGLQRGSVHRYISTARRQGHDIPPVPRSLVQQRSTQVRVSRLVLGGLAEAAARRGLTERELATKLLDVVVMDGLIDAILDDEVAHG